MTVSTSWPCVDKPIHQFTGKERDAETGLDYFGARYFSSPQGRFTSPDGPFNDQSPDNPQSWNLYNYGRNNPLAFIDPDGTTTCDANGNNCHDDVTVNGGETDPVGYVWSFLRAAGSQTLQNTATVLDSTLEYVRSRDWQYPSCVAGKMGTWGAVGTAAGASAGTVGFALAGVGEVVTVPGGAAIGGGVGAISGGISGLITCSSGTGNGGSSGGDGRASGSEARLTKPQQRQTVKYLGMKEVKGLTSQGQPVFEKGGRYFTFSNTGHTAGEVFKELDRSGNRIATTDLNLNRIGR